MNKLWLEYFCTIAKYNSITKAAQTLSISQSSLSQTVAKLEQQLGVKLVERASRGIELTKQGRLFLEYATESLIREKNIRQELLDIGGEPVGDIVIGAYGMSTVIVKLFVEFKKLYPKVDIIFNQERVISRSRETAYPDLIITGLPVNEEEMEYIDLITEEFFLTVAADHPLAKRNSVLLEELAKERFIVMGDPERLDSIDYFCSMCGFKPNIWLKCNTPVAIENVVSMGIAVSLIPNTWRQRFFSQDSRIVTLPIEYPICQRTIRLAWNKDQYMSKATALFRDYLIENFVEVFHKSMEEDMAGGPSLQ